MGQILNLNKINKNTNSGWCLLSADCMPFIMLNTCVTCFHLHQSPCERGLSYRYGNWGSENWNNLPRVSEPHCRAPNLKCWRQMGLLRRLWLFSTVRVSASLTGIGGFHPQPLSLRVTLCVSLPLTCSPEPGCESGNAAWVLSELEENALLCWVLFPSLSKQSA